MKTAVVKYWHLQHEAHPVCQGIVVQLPIANKFLLLHKISTQINDEAAGKLSYIEIMDHHNPHDENQWKNLKAVKLLPIDGGTFDITVRQIYDNMDPYNFDAVTNNCNDACEKAINFLTLCGTPNKSGDQEGHDNEESMID